MAHARRPLSGLTITYDDFYQNLRNWGYNVIRLPVQWQNLEPIAPTWDAQAGQYVHNWNQNYLNDLRSMITKARAAGIMVILDMQQDFWSPALHNITNWDGTPGYCEGYGMPRWMYPSIDVKPATTQSTDFFNGMNWFFRNIHDPMATVTRATPWDLYGDVWEMLAYEFSAASGFPDYQAVVGADMFNEPWWSYVGGNPPAGQTVAQAAGSRLLAFYTTLAPAITANSPNWLLFFQDTGGGYYSANPSLRESPWMTGKADGSGKLGVLNPRLQLHLRDVLRRGAAARRLRHQPRKRSAQQRAGVGRPAVHRRVHQLQPRGRRPQPHRRRHGANAAVRRLGQAERRELDVLGLLQPMAADVDDGLHDQPAYHGREEHARQRARRTGRSQPTAGRFIHLDRHRPAGRVRRVRII